GNVYYKGAATTGNTGFAQNQIIKMEYDSEKGTVIFFVNGTQQPVYISGIKEKIRFVIHFYRADQICIIHSFKKLAAPTSATVSNEKAVQW
ncbi:MAG: hypothetical protein EZS28_048876, partial [Streblomastix strix]